MSKIKSGLVTHQFWGGGFKTWASQRKVDFRMQFLDLTTDLDLKFLCKDHRWLTWVISEKQSTDFFFLGMFFNGLYVSLSFLPIPLSFRALFLSLTLSLYLFLSLSVLSLSISLLDYLWHLLWIWRIVWHPSTFLISPFPIHISQRQISVLRVVTWPMMAQ